MQRYLRQLGRSGTVVALVLAGMNLVRAAGCEPPIPPVDLDVTSPTVRNIERDTCCGAAYYSTVSAEACDSMHATLCEGYIVPYGIRDCECLWRTAVPPCDPDEALEAIDRFLEVRRRCSEEGMWVPPA